MWVPTTHKSLQGSSYQTRLKMEELMNAPQEEQISGLYLLTRQDPDLLQLADNPLHSAAGRGCTLLALEIQRVMPSFATKLNPDGFTPLDLAHRQGHTNTVKNMVKLNPQLVCIQGREGITPLHYAAETDNVNLLEFFLRICPNSIEELTVRRESAVHVAAKNGRLETVRVLLGWLKRMGRRKVAGWRDWEGNTALHLASLNNHSEVIELLAKAGYVNAKNFQGLTALDLVTEPPTEVNDERAVQILPTEVNNERAVQILPKNGAKLGSSIIPGHPKIPSFPDYLSWPITFLERTFIRLTQIELRYLSEISPHIQVVVSIIAAATFQAVLSPPVRYRYRSSITNNATTTTSNVTSVVGGHEERMSELFRSSNSIAFVSSVGMLCCIMPRSLYFKPIYVAITFLFLRYFFILKGAFPKAAVIHVTPLDPFRCMCTLVFLGMMSTRSFTVAMFGAWAIGRFMHNKYLYKFERMLTLLYGDRKDLL